MQSLQTTAYLDYKQPKLQQYIGDNTRNLTDPVEIAVALYYAVRDDIRYDPYNIDMSVEGLRASTALANGFGWCVSKAILLAACYRAKGIPARLGFANVKNHLTSARLREQMQTDVFAWHGYTSVLLNDKWVKATPAFNKELCEKANLYPLEFNGREDSIYHEFDRAGQKHMEYLVDHGEFDDLPIEQITADFAKLYGSVEDSPASGEDSAANFTEDVARETAAKLEAGQ